MVSSKAKVDCNCLRVTDVEESIGLGGKSGENGFHRSDLEDIVQETRLKHVVRIDGRLLEGGLRLRGRLGLLLGLGLTLRGLFGLGLVALLHSLLQLGLGDHLAGLLVQLQLGSALYQVRHGCGSGYRWFGISVGK